MPLQIIRHDITAMAVDAIVSPTDTSLSGSGGVDAAIHAAAGPRLTEKCRRLGNCAPGQAVLTRGYLLPCRYILHTVGPIWQGGTEKEADILAQCYRNCLKIASLHRFESVAFPLIASGSCGFPRELALQIATSTIRRFLLTRDMTVYLVVFDRSSFALSQTLQSDIAEYIDQNYVTVHTPSLNRRLPLEYIPTLSSAPTPRPAPAPGASPVRSSLRELVEQVDESFSKMLLRKIDEKGITDAQCYKKANIDRKLFSKIRKDIHYHPSKSTALAFAVALELSLAETRDLLEKAGFALSHSSKADIIIEYFIQNRKYDIFEINEALFAFDQSLLGG